MKTPEILQHSYMKVQSCTLRGSILSGKISRCGSEQDLSVTIGRSIDGGHKRIFMW